MADFDPDAYLAQKGTATVDAPKGFDPDAYLKAKAPAAPENRTGGVQENAGKPSTGMRDPRTGLPMTRDFEGIPGRVNFTKGAALQGGFATAGGTIGALPIFSVPTLGLSIPAGAFLGGALGNVLHQETSPGYDANQPGLGIKKGEALASGLVSGIPGGSSAAGGVTALAKEGAKQAFGGVLAKNIETGIDEHRFATGKEDALAGLGGLVAGTTAQKLQSLNPAAQKAMAATPSVEQQSYDAGRKLGLVTTAGEGKPPAVMANLASTKNQPKINEAAAADLGLPKNTEITIPVLDKIREEAGQPYAQIEQIATDAAKKAADIRKARFTATDPHELAIQMNDPATVKELGPLDIQAAADVNGLREARLQVKKGFAAWNNGRGDPKALQAAEDALALANKLEDQIDQAAVASGKPDLVKDLNAARTRIAKTYDYQRALNTSNADISAPELGRMLDNRKPLSGNALAIANFNNAFPFATKEGATVMAPGVTRAEGMTALLSVLSGAGAGGAAGHSAGSTATGALIGAAPLLGPLKRQVVLSQPYQAVFPKYGAPQIPAGVVDQEALTARLLAQAAGQRASDN